MNITTLRQTACTGSLGMALACLALAHSSQAQTAKVSASFSMPTRVQAVVTTMDCENHPGPTITLEGGLILGGLNVDFIFRNNINKDVHVRTESVTVNASLIPKDSRIQIPKQPVRGGTGGNPFIWVQFIDGKGNAVSKEIFLGRCVQGLFNVDKALGTLTSTMLNVLVEGCENSPGPYITFDGSFTFKQGLSVQFIFRNNDNPVGGPHEAIVKSDAIMLIPPDVSITFPKQPVRGGVGGNPWISVQFRNGDGTAIGGEVLLGRCEQLSKQ